jgi:hypothetical protein
VSYKDQCSINWRIPQYLIVAGAVGIVAITLQIVQNLLALYLAKKMSDTDIQPSGLLGFCAATCGVCSICTTVGILSLFLFSWGIAGCVWIFGAYNQVQYLAPKKKATYCDETLYRAAFWLVIIAMAYYVYGCCCSGVQGRKQMNIAQKRGTRSGGSQA